MPFMPFAANGKVGGIWGGAKGVRGVQGGGRGERPGQDVTLAGWQRHCCASLSFELQCCYSSQCLRTLEGLRQALIHWQRAEQVLRHRIQCM